MAVIPKPFRESKPRAPKSSGARERVLAQWRGVNVAPLEKARAATERKVADLMPKVLTGMRMDQRRAEAEIVKVWNDLIDPQIVKHAQPANLHNGTLFVNVDSSPWLDEIVRYRRKEILDRLQHGFGRDAIKRISFRVG